MLHQSINSAGSYTEKIVEFKDFSRLLSDFPVLFEADLIFKNFQDSPLNSSTCQACVNHVKLCRNKTLFGWKSSTNVP